MGSVCMASNFYPTNECGEQSINKGINSYCIESNKTESQAMHRIFIIRFIGLSLAINFWHHFTVDSNDASNDKHLALILRSMNSKKSN